MADGGYDITGHTGIDPVFSAMESFNTLRAEAPARGPRVIMDFVPNHTSDQHPWLLARRSSRDSPKREWYLWHDPATGGDPPTQTG